MTRAAALAILCLSCAGSGRRDGALDTAAARRLVGVWTVILQRSPVPPARPPAAGASVAGTIAIIQNRSGPPLRWGARELRHSGSFDIGLGRWSLDPGSRSLAAATFGDSVEIVLDPGAGDRSIRMLGAWRGDDLLGRWAAVPRASAASIGSFVMKRERP